MHVTIPYGRGEHLSAHIPDDQLLGVVEPRPTVPLPDVEAGVRAALSFPIGSPPLEDLVHPGHPVAIVVDDITRATPTARLLPPILQQLSRAGVTDRDVSIVFATGGHRQHTIEEQRRLVGAAIFERYRCLDHDALDESSLADLGYHAWGIPIRVNRYVAEADLRILTGSIHAHDVAGYSGGGKAILPGVSGLDTIMKGIHGFKATSDPASVIGIIEGNPVRQAIEAVAQVLAPTFIVNTILNRDKEAVAVVAGGMIAAHRHGAHLVDEAAKVPVPGVADIVITCATYPTDICLYQGLNSIAGAVRLPRPIVRAGGAIILTGTFLEGVGSDDFYRLVRDHASPQALLDRLSRSDGCRRDQHAAQCWAQAAQWAAMYVVTDGVPEDILRAMWVTPARSVDAALEMAGARLGKSPTVLVLPDAAYTIAMLPG
jgi:nickel-dependent lactate racemase